MATVTELKEVFRDGWCNQARVDNWVQNATCGEFEDLACRAAWLAALREVTAGAPLADTLDAGTGPGTIAGLWSELGAASVGLDFSATMIAAGREIASRTGRHVYFVEGDAEHPPFAPGSFDVVSSRLVLFTLPHPGYAVRRWVDQLRPGGLLILIGEDHPERPLSDPAEPQPPPPKHSAALPNKPRWTASESYREALAELPFMKHSSGNLQVVMEAAGLEGIRRVPLPDVATAREARRAAQPGARIMQSQPYLVVGRKPLPATPRGTP